MSKKKELTKSWIQKNIESGSKHCEQDIHDEHIIWDFVWCDTKCWPILIDNKRLLKKIKDISNASIISIMHETHGYNGKSSSHWIHKKSKLSKESRKRLRDLKFYYKSNFFSLRLNGTTRIYGFLFNNIFKVLWLDKKHQIYPEK